MTVYYKTRISIINIQLTWLGGDHRPMLGPDSNFALQAVPLKHDCPVFEESVGDVDS